MEEPGYFGIRSTLNLYRYRIDRLRCDDCGAIPDSRVLSKARLVYLTPSHHFPTNVTLSADRRRTFAEQAAECGCTLLEDDYDGNFTFDGTAPPALFATAPIGTVVYVGSFSKVLAPGLRLGYVIAEKRLIERLAALRWRISRHPPLILQAAMSTLVATGHFQRYEALLMRVYKRRWKAMRCALREHLNYVPPGTGGLSAWVSLRMSWRAFEEMQPRWKKAGIVVESGRACFAQLPRTASMRLGLGRIGSRRIVEGVKLLSEQFTRQRTVGAQRSRLR
jgi:GntR family transcriptional regulator/MocR family aminotransferase